MPPSAPGSTTPGWKISKPMPAMPARKSRLEDVRVDERVQQPREEARLRVVDVRAGEVQRERPLRILRPVAVELDEQRRQARRDRSRSRSSAAPSAP